MVSLPDVHPYEYVPCPPPGGVLYGPGPGRSQRVSPLQDPEGRVSGPAGTLPRGPVGCQVTAGGLTGRAGTRLTLIGQFDLQIRLDPAL